eukprot:2020516-Alexandrium_andersonii.AAC.1
MAGPLTSPQLLDTRSIGKPREFSGREVDYPDWAFVVRNYLVMLDADFGAALGARQDRESRVTPTTEKTQQLGRALFNILTQTVRGPGLKLLR